MKNAPRLLLAVLFALPAALPAAASADPDGAPHRVERRRDVGGGIGHAFRTAGNAVAYGVHEVGRTITSNPREDERAERYRARTRAHARETRREMRGY